MMMYRCKSNVPTFYACKTANLVMKSKATTSPSFMQAHLSISHIKREKAARIRHLAKNHENKKCMLLAWLTNRTYVIINFIRHSLSLIFT